MHQHRDAGWQHGRTGRVRQHRHGAAGDRVSGEPGAVHIRSLQGREQVSGLRILRAQRHPGHLNRRNLVAAAGFGADPLG